MVIGAVEMVEEMGLTLCQSLHLGRFDPDAANPDGAFHNYGSHQCADSHGR